MSNTFRRVLIGSVLNGSLALNAYIALFALELRSSSVGIRAFNAFDGYSQIFEYCSILNWSIIYTKRRYVS